MALEPFDGFQAFPTLHCVTGSMRHVYQLCGQDIGEELLLGLGAGVGFIYWHQKGVPPFLGGRANVTKPGGKDGFEILAGRRTGVDITFHLTKSTRRARAELLADLRAGIPAMLQVDMGFLPYFGFGGTYHFGGHVVTVVGYNEEHDMVLVSDRDEQPHPVALDILEQARASQFQPFPPQHGYWKIDLTHQRTPRPDEVRVSIGEAAAAMLNPPIRNLGVAGIRRAAALVPTWPTRLEPEELTLACQNGFIMIDATGGTGGGLFRYMYGRFLEQAAALTGDAALSSIAARFRDAGDQWQEVAVLFQEAATAGGSAAPLQQIASTLSAIAEVEELAWNQLAGKVATHTA